MIFITSRIYRLDSNHSLSSTHGSSFGVRFPVFQPYATFTILLLRLSHDIWFLILDLLVARLCGIFRNENDDWNVDQQSFCKGTSSNLDSLKRWKEEMQKKVEEKSISITSRSRVNVKATVEPVNEGMMGTNDFPWQAVLGEESGLSAIDPSQLNDEQVSFGHGICENVTNFVLDSVARLIS